MTDPQDPEQYAAEIDAARQRLIRFIDGCGQDDWHAAPLEGDPRPVAVIVDHVAHSYDYMGAWMREILAGQQVTVSADIVDAHNARHAISAAQVSQAEAAAHLRRNGDAIVGLVAGLSRPELDAGDGLIRRFAQISIRHADDHRASIEAALAASANLSWRAEQSAIMAAQPDIAYDETAGKATFS